MELTVLGCSGSFGSPPAGACSGYLVRDAETAIWVDCGNGTLPHLLGHLSVEDLDAVVVSHVHPDHCVDLYGLHVLLSYELGMSGLPVFGPDGMEGHLGALVGGNWGSAFEWQGVGDGDEAQVGSMALRFSRTDHPVPTNAVELAADGRRLVYTADTGPGWSVDAFGPGADLVVSESTYLHADRPVPTHLSALQAGTAAREATAGRLMITHLWPRVPPEQALLEAADAFGDTVTLAAMHLVTHV